MPQNALEESRAAAEEQGAQNGWRFADDFLNLLYWGNLAFFHNTNLEACMRNSYHGVVFFQLPVGKRRVST